MSFSLNEVEAMAKNAARGGHYSWAMAKEAGRATRWLCAQGQDGCGALAGMLRVQEAEKLLPPSVRGEEWRADTGKLCPLSVGTAASDRAASLTGQVTVVHGVVFPLLLMPFFSSASRVSGQIVFAQVDEAKAKVAADGIRLQGAFPDEASQVIITFGSGNFEPAEKHTRAIPRDEDWLSLKFFAHRTYAPATEESRRLGAGESGGSRN
ncbi:uncharacterized protein DUF3726 [Shimia isoporae]|uniref:Uncharacterized protein DUF3726 n=1 Tax=Shimia isoporae TaxID=647720 RepID=A0A4R1NXA2_9RHOB|nr:DUF3726 domain-containing protein [Shimia isoporae]TCL09898.1 uncharacterized protein DUF3726 [Shimia isoporae]